MCEGSNQGPADGAAADEPPGRTAGELALWVARCRDGDAAAWRWLVARFQRLVYTIVGRAGLDEHAAGDVFQTVFERLHQHLPRIDQPERLQAWVVTTAKREVLRALEQRRRVVSLDPTPGDDEDGGGSLLDTLVDDSPAAEQRLADLQDLDRLRWALERLDERCRTLLTLLFADDEDRPAYEDIAARLGMAMGSIGPTRQRCLGKLRQVMA